MAAVLILCGLGAAVCIAGVVLHLRVVRRLELLAREVEKRVVPYLRRHAAALHYETAKTAALRTPEQVVADACQLADDLLDLERKADDLALGPTQNLPATGASKLPRKAPV
ncbi:MAG TPA: hypothetical protein VGQ83_38150 [Polyangia bacterium]